MLVHCMHHRIRFNSTFFVYLLFQNDNGDPASKMPPPVRRHPQSFNSLRKQLDEMGYFQPLVMDALPLVEALVYDLVSVTNDARAKRTRDFRVAPEECKPQSATKTKCKSESEMQLREKISDLERQVVDLQLLNAQSVSVVKRLQEESYEKSCKIAKMDEALSKGARVIVRQPKIEMTSLRKPRQRRLSPPPEAPKIEFDLVAMYDNRTRQLSEELGRMQRKLDEAHGNLAKMERALEERERTLDPLPPAAAEEPQSAYMLHLIHENERLKKRMMGEGGMDGHGRRVQIADPPVPPSPPRQLKSKPRSLSSHHSPHAHPRSHLGQQHIHSQYHSCEDIRSAVELSHLQMHNMCLKSQVEHLAREGSRSTDCLMEEYDLVRAELKKALVDNGALKRRMQDLNSVKNRLKSEVEELRRQQSILIKSGSPDDYGKIKELIGYIEHQRNVYKNNVERLIGRLDPDGSKTEKSLIQAVETDEPKRKGKVNSAQVLKDIQNQSRRIIHQCESPKAPSGSTRDETTELEENSYHPSEYRNLSATRVSRLLETSSGIAASESKEEDAAQQRERVERILTLEREIAKVKGALADLRREKAEAETRLRAEADALQAENAKLSDAMSALRERLAAAEKSESAKERYPSSLTELKRQLEEKAAQVCGLEATLADKHLHLQRMSDDKDRMQSMLDDKTVELVEVRRRGVEAESAAGRAEADKTVAEQRLQQCMDEMSRLNAGLHDEEGRTRAMRERMSAEKAVGVDLRRDNER